MPQKLKGPCIHQERKAYICAMCRKGDHARCHSLACACKPCREETY